jgi:hypothetical protein
MLKRQILFRLKAFGWHLLASASALAIILGGLYFGWYKWPGWYLADVSQVVKVMVAVDLVVGPLLTLVIAVAAKKRRVLARDVTVIIVVQLIALGYGSVSLWNGRPLYFAFSEDVLQLVQAYDISASEAALGVKTNANLAPHWYSLPRWIWAPLPADPSESQKIVSAAISGGDDVISMPRYYKSWAEGLSALRDQLKALDDQKYFSGNEKKILKRRMQETGLPTDQKNTLALTGRGHPLLAVFDPEKLKIVAVLAAT